MYQRPPRRPAAILFADLEASSPLSCRLSTASYFALGRRLVRAADQCVIDADGLVGRHVGDDVVAFFLAESAGSKSAAARACITAARALRDAVSAVAARSDLQPEDVVLRFGLHSVGFSTSPSARDWAELALERLEEGALDDAREALRRARGYCDGPTVNGGGRRPARR